MLCSSPPQEVVRHWCSVRVVHAYSYLSVAKLLISLYIKRPVLLLLFCSMSHLSLSLYLCCILSALSPFPSPLSPTPISSRNWSGSGSCRSMEIWVRTVYVIVASINALLICSGLQPSIHIIHPHAHMAEPKLLLHTHTHISEKHTESHTHTHTLTTRKKPK